MKYTLIHNGQRYLILMQDVYGIKGLYRSRSFIAEILSRFTPFYQLNPVWGTRYRWLAQHRLEFLRNSNRENSIWDRTARKERA